MGEEEQTNGKDPKQPDDSEPSPERQAELEAAYETNVAAGNPPYKGVRIWTRGELKWVMEKRRWLGGIFMPEGSQRINLSSANLERANLSGAFMVAANLSSADLIYANLSKANLRESRMGFGLLASRWRDDPFTPLIALISTLGIGEYLNTSWVG